MRKATVTMFIGKPDEWKSSKFKKVKTGLNFKRKQGFAVGRIPNPENDSTIEVIDVFDSRFLYVYANISEWFFSDRATMPVTARHMRIFLMKLMDGIGDDDSSILLGSNSWIADYHMGEMLFGSIFSSPIYVGIKIQNDYHKLIDKAMQSFINGNMHSSRGGAHGIVFHFDNDAFHIMNENAEEGLEDFAMLEPYQLERNIFHFNELLQKLIIPFELKEAIEKIGLR
ncbi:MAG: hypothetical protein NT126_03920 [Bacteroidetes bacterium]|nr:hypothetical protein [Bacteroidota bacterium]